MDDEAGVSTGTSRHPARDSQTPRTSRSAHGPPELTESALRERNLRAIGCSCAPARVPYVSDLDDSRSVVSSYSMMSSHSVGSRSTGASRTHSSDGSVFVKFAWAGQRAEGRIALQRSQSVQEALERIAKSASKLLATEITMPMMLVEYRLRDARGVVRRVPVTTSTRLADLRASDMLLISKNPAWEA